MKNNKLKFIVLAAMLMIAPIFASAQSDGFFSNWSDEGNRGGNSTGAETNDFGTAPQNKEPLGSGLLILTAAGVGYAFIKKDKNQVK